MQFVQPNDTIYDTLRRAWSLTVDQHPALILEAEKVQDVIEGVQYAREHGLGIAVQSTGHGLKVPADDALLILTSQMAGVTVNPAARTARIEAGAVWKQVIEAVAPHGLAPLLGSSPYVGVVGYTLGGGIGWLARKYGLAVDSVLSVEIVTADGVLRHASATENKDLFWALRGGGGNFGVVTALEIQLYPVATLYGGNLVYPIDCAADALRFFRQWTQTAPDDLTSSIGIAKFPNLPQLPETIRGKMMVIVRAAYLGETQEGEKLIQQWLDWALPMSNTFREMPFPEIGTISNDPVDPVASYGSHEMLKTLSDDVIELIVRYATHPESPLIQIELRHAGGAIARVEPDNTAMSHRDAAYYMQMGGVIFTPEIGAAMKPYISEYKAALRPHLHGGVFLNFMVGSEANQRLHDAFPPQTYERLKAIKAQYDPTDVFRFSYRL